MPLPGVLFQRHFALIHKRYSQGCSLHKKYATVHTCHCMSTRGGNKLWCFRTTGYSSSGKMNGPG